MAKPSYGAAFETLAPWMNLMVVPVYVWRRAPAALLPRVRLSELVFWNVTAVAISFGARVGGNAASSLGTLLFWIFFYSLFLWPSGLALIAKKWNSDSLAPLLRLPLVAYYWLSLLYWLLFSLWERESSRFGLLGLADSVFEAFAALQCFAVVYFVYYVSNAEVEALDLQTGERVGSAVFEAIQVDDWRPLALVAAAGVYGVAVLAFAWTNAAYGWGYSTYGLLLLPYVFSEVMAELREPERPPGPMRNRRPQRPALKKSA